MLTQKGITVPPDLGEVLRIDTQALAAFEAQRPSCQVRWVALIEGAKRPETRARRVKRVIEMALERKARQDGRRRKTQAV